ncbi:MAG: hypothetical protein FK734_09545 [Asgard group archaeon]|nr:hypothetical protein [Asgard group archaeon]
MQSNSINSRIDTINQPMHTNDWKLFLQTILIILVMNLLLLQTNFKTEDTFWKFYGGGKSIYVDLISNYWSINIDYSYYYYGVTEFKNYALAVYGITIHYNAIILVLLILGLIVFALGFTYWIFLVILQKNCFVSKKSPPGILGVSFLTTGSFIMLLGYLSCLRLNNDLIHLAKAMGNYSTEGFSTFLFTFTIIGVIFIISLFLLILVFNKSQFVPRSETNPMIIQERKKALGKTLIITIICGIVSSSLNFVLGIVAYTNMSNIPGYFGFMGSMYFIESVIIGILIGFSSRFRTIVFDIASLAAIIFSVALIGPTYLGNIFGYGPLWEISLPWIGVCNTSIFIFLLAIIVSRSRGYLNYETSQTNQNAIISSDKT